MSHIVYKVGLHFRKLFLTENQEYSIKEYYEQYDGEGKSGDDEPHRGKYVIAFCRELNAELIVDVSVGEKRNIVIVMVIFGLYISVSRVEEIISGII